MFSCLTHFSHLSYKCFLKNLIIFLEKKYPKIINAQLTFVKNPQLKIISFQKEKHVINVIVNKQILT